MEIVICDICGTTVSQPATHKEGLRFEIPLAQSPKQFKPTIVDLCFPCGQELSKAFVALKGLRDARKS